MNSPDEMMENNYNTNMNSNAVHDPLDRNNTEMGPPEAMEIDDADPQNATSEATSGNENTDSNRMDWQESRNQQAANVPAGNRGDELQQSPPAIITNIVENRSICVNESSRHGQPTKKKLTVELLYGGADIFKGIKRELEKSGHNVILRLHGVVEKGDECGYLAICQLYELRDFPQLIKEFCVEDRKQIIIKFFNEIIDKNPNVAIALHDFHILEIIKSLEHIRDKCPKVCGIPESLEWLRNNRPGNIECVYLAICLIYQWFGYPKLFEKFRDNRKEIIDFFNRIIRNDPNVVIPLQNNQIRDIVKALRNKCPKSWGIPEFLESLCNNRPDNIDAEGDSERVYSAICRIYKWFGFEQLFKEFRWNSVELVKFFNTPEYDSLVPAIPSHYQIGEISEEMKNIKNNYIPKIIEWCHNANRDFKRSLILDCEFPNHKWPVVLGKDEFERYLAIQEGHSSEFIVNTVNPGGGQGHWYPGKIYQQVIRRGLH